VLPVAVVLLYKTALPIAVLFEAVVFAANAVYPNAVL